MDLIKHKPRFESYFKVVESGCWIWQNCTLGSGYGYFKIGTISYRAHRISYQLYVGDIPDGLWILHKCDVKACVNPEHLYAGDAKDNMRDIKERLKPNWGRPFNTSPRCKHGHLMLGDNLAYDKKGYRYCMACSKSRSGLAYKKRKLLQSLGHNCGKRIG